MNIVVCIKQVPDTNEVKFDSVTNNIIREGTPSIINPYDAHGVEAALQIKADKGGRVTVVSMGPHQAKEALQYCLEMGADEAILLSDKAVSGSDTLATAYALSELIKTINADLIICGNEAIDGCTGQVGPIIAGNLGVTQFTYVRDFKIEGNKLIVWREVGSNIEHYEAKLPALICVLKDINHLRIGSKTDKKPRIVTATELNLKPAKIGIDGSPTRVVEIRISDIKAKSYVEIDDSLPWDKRIEMIINGGLTHREKIDLWRGSADELANRLLTQSELIKSLGL